MRSPPELRNPQVVDAIPCSAHCVGRIRHEGDVMSDTASWATKITAITVLADDLEAAKDFYQRVFGLPVHFEGDTSAVFLFGETMINLLTPSQGPELMDPAPIAPASAGHRQVFTITVDDVDAKVAELQALGVELLNGPIDRPWGIRTASFIDPAGIIWEIAT
jgi:catechol 2,3-dioxygenase-like lactoylglutathione lyase family enzyme